MSFMSKEIREYVGGKEANRATELKETEHTLPSNVRLSIWSVRSDNIDHSLVVQHTENSIQLIQGLKWAVRDPQETWSIRLKLTELKKTWCPTSADTRILQNHVNSGMTTHRWQNKTIEIDIWRLEDVGKVILHELLHAFLFDRLVSSKSIEERFVHEHEAFIEAIARYLYYYLIVGRRDPRNDPLWQRQLAHQQNQVDRLRQTKWTSDTWTVSYYWLCHALMRNGNEFYAWVFSSPSTKTVEDMRAEWPALRDRSWCLAYEETCQGRGNRPQVSKMWTTTRNLSCLNLNMVAYQMNFSRSAPSSSIVRRGGYCKKLTRVLRSSRLLI